VNKKYKIILMLLIVIITISSYFLIKGIAENKIEKDIFEDLQEILQNTENSTNDIEDTDILNNKTSNLLNENINNNYNLENILKINSDVIGWIRIDGTNINYPIMQNGNYYLHRNIYKNYSSHGTPYLAEYCNLKTSDNLIIYGHHMNDNTMFSGLVNYKNYNYYKNHKYIHFYTLENGQTIESIYEIVIAFKTIVYSDNGFKYYNYTNFYDEQEFNSFVENSRILELYNTGVDLKYGDKLLTLSTCEYSQKNGRMVVVAKKI
jgi:sortase B